MDRQHHDLLEVDDVDRYWKELLALDLPTKYKGVRLTPVRRLEWGSEMFLHDPSGILWHFASSAHGRNRRFRYANRFLYKLAVLRCRGVLRRTEVRRQATALIRPG